MATIAVHYDKKTYYNTVIYDENNNIIYQYATDNPVRDFDMAKQLIYDMGDIVTYESNIKMIGRYMLNHKQYIWDDIQERICERKIKD